MTERLLPRLTEAENRDLILLAELVAVTAMLARELVEEMGGTT